MEVNFLGRGASLCKKPKKGKAKEERKKKRKTRIQARDCESVWTEKGKDYEENRRSLSNLAIGSHHWSQQPQHLSGGFDLLWSGEFEFELIGCVCGNEKKA